MLTESQQATKLRTEQWDGHRALTRIAKKNEPAVAAIVATAYAEGLTDRAIVRAGIAMDRLLSGIHDQQNAAIENAVKRSAAVAESA